MRRKSVQSYVREISQLKEEQASLEKQIDDRLAQKRMFDERRSAGVPGGFPAAEENQYRQVLKELDGLQQQRSKLVRQLSYREKKVAQLRQKEAVEWPDFANREKELKELQRRSSALPYQQIYAPAGYGKTRLLRKLQQVFLEEDERWTTAWLSFKDTGAARDSKEAVLDGLLASVGVHRPRGGSLTSRLNEFCKVLSKRPRVLLLIDAIELAEEDILAFIEDELIENIGQRKVLIHELRVFFAGRYRRVRDRMKIASKFDFYPLSHFSREDLELVVFKRAPHIPVDGRQAIARNLLWLTRGHPKCVALILDSLEEEGFNPRWDKRGRFVQHKEYFEKIVKKVVYDEIIHDVIAEGTIELEGLKTLCVLRKLTPDFLEILSDHPSLERYGLSELGKRQVFLTRDLRTTGLFSLPLGYQAQMFEVDPVVRHVFALEDLYADSSKHCGLHSLVWSTYERWCIGPFLEGQVIPRGSRQNLLMVEALYHLCQESRFQKLDPSSALDRLVTKLHEWKPCWQPDDGMPLDLHQREFRNRIRDDLDLPLALEELVGSEGYERLLEECIV